LGGPAETAPRAVALGHRLIFIRHGETDWNVERRLQGQKDTPLNGRGRDQASAVGRLVRDWRGADLANLRFVASPLGRTCETMRLARAAMGLPPDAFETEPRLMELTFGRWEGLTWEELKAIDPWAARAREGDKWSFTPPGGESYAMLAERLRPWPAAVESETVVVSHGGVARVLMALAGGVPIGTAPVSDIHQGRALIFEDGRCRWL
jgi:broad specificity phosphatase PhoE